MEFNEIKCNPIEENPKERKEGSYKQTVDLRMDHAEMGLRENLNKLIRKSRDQAEKLSDTNVPCEHIASNETGACNEPSNTRVPTTPLSQLSVKNIIIKPVKTYKLQLLKKEVRNDPKFLFSKEYGQIDQSDERLYHTNKRIFLYKTELCRSFSELGYCKYGDRCQFSHSPVELRGVSRHPKYKTETCRVFWEKGTCPYGKRCCFLHSKTDLDKDEPFPEKQKAPFLMAVESTEESQSKEYAEINTSLYSRDDLIKNSEPYNRKRVVKRSHDDVQEPDDEIELCNIDQGKEEPSLISKLFGIDDLDKKIREKAEYREVDYEYKRNLDRISFDDLN